MTETVTLPDRLVGRARAEAKRNHGGDLTALTAAAVEYYLDTQDGQRVLRERHPAVPGESEPARLARAMAAANVSTATIEAMAATLAQVAGLEPGFRQAGTAQEYLRTHLDWVAADPVGHMAGCAVVSVQTAAGAAGAQRTGIIGFGQGFLGASGRSLSGSVRQWFSDRTAGPAAHPFDPARADDLGVTLALDELTGYVTVELTAHTWGDARQVLTDVRLGDGVLVGSGGGVGNQAPRALYAVTLSTVVAPG